jgi:hypothetical protein
MTRLSLFLGILSLAILSGCNSAPSGPATDAPASSAKANAVDLKRAPFVGGWYTGERTLPDGGTDLGWWIELRADGTFRRVGEFGGIVRTSSGKWSVRNGSLRLTGMDGFTCRRDGEDLRTFSKGEPRERLTRSDAMPEKLAALPPQPKSVEEAVGVLKKILSQEDQAEIASMCEDDLIEMHFGLGMWIRNAFGLWGGNKELLASCGDPDMHPDYASSVILQALWESLRRERPDYADLVALEQRLQIKIPRFQVRDLSYSEFVERLNEATKIALVAAGESPDSLTFVFVPNTELLKDRTEPRLSFFQMLKIWGTERGAAYEPASLETVLSGVKTVLKPPSTVLVSYDEDSVIPDWARSKLGWETISWRNDSFDARITTGSDALSQNSWFPGVYRAMSWEMVAELPPMSAQEAISLFEQDASLINGEQLVSVEMTMSRNSDDASPAPTIWHYLVGAYVRPINDFKPGERLEYGHLETPGKSERCSYLYYDSFGPESVWTDYAKGPPLEPLEAYERLKRYLAHKKRPFANPYRVSIELRRAYLTDFWFYEINIWETKDGSNTIMAFVRLDGKVVPFDRLAD